jgi:glycosyltransferase involved in cell wall biosynthesis
MIRPSSALDGNGPIVGRSVTSETAVMPLHDSSRRSDQTGSSWRHRTAGPSPLASRTICSRKALLVGGFVFPWKTFQVRTSRRSTVLRMRVVLADPPAFTPVYDHELAAALAARGLDVELVTSRFRFGETPAPDGYRRSEPFYPLSSRLFNRSRARIPLKLLEHVPGSLSLLRRRADVLHLQWLAAPELDRFLLRVRVPTVFTAHDLVPRRTAKRQALWRKLLARFDRVVVHSERGRATLAELGVDARVIAHPVFPSEPARADDGRTLLCLGTIRPYKGLGDAIAAARQIDGARLLVAGDPLEPLNGYRAQAGDRAEWRLGYLSQEELERALGEATVALFPYRPELDQSGALLQALGAGVPAVAYDVGGIAEPVRQFGAGRVVEPGDVSALAAAARELLDDPAALEAARAGARRARETLTWQAAAEAHEALYRELA